VAEQDSENPPAQFLQSLSLNESIVEFAALTWFGELVSTVPKPVDRCRFENRAFPAKRGRSSLLTQTLSCRLPDRPWIAPGRAGSESIGRSCVNSEDRPLLVRFRRFRCPEHTVSLGSPNHEISMEFRRARCCFELDGQCLDYRLLWFCRAVHGE
jgi:hypothetical protein